MSSQPSFYGHPNLPLMQNILARDLAVSPNLHSDDDGWDKNGRPLSITQPTVAVPTTHLKTTAPESQHSQPLPLAANSQGWMDAVNVADAANAALQKRQQLLTETINQPPLMKPISVGKEVVEESQMAAVKIQRSASILSLHQTTVTAETQRPTTTIKATKPQIPIIPDRISMTTRVSVSSPLPEQDQIDVVTRSGARAEPSPAPKLKRSIRSSIRRTASRAFGGTLAVLRIGGDDSPASESSKASIAMAKWNALLLQHQQQCKTMEGAYRPFRDTIEEAFDSKYVELRGEGRFLIHDEPVELPVRLSSKLPVELPVEEKEATAPSEAEGAWLMHSKKEDKITEFHDPHTGSVWRSISTSESLRVKDGFLVCSPPMSPQTAALESGLTYAPDPPTLPKMPQSEQPGPDVGDWHEPTPIPTGSHRPLSSRPVMDDEHSHKSSPSSGSKLPRPAVSGVNGSSATGHINSNIQADAAKIDRTPYKSRKDSVQPGALQPRDRYPRIQTVPKR
ncbi:hypothetical protein M3J09_010920 [Ascochyta lentis]